MSEWESGPSTTVEEAAETRAMLPAPLKPGWRCYRPLPPAPLGAACAAGPESPQVIASPRAALQGCAAPGTALNRELELSGGTFCREVGAGSLGKAQEPRAPKGARAESIEGWGPDLRCLASHNVYNCAAKSREATGVVSLQEQGWRAQLLPRPLRTRKPWPGSGCAPSRSPIYTCICGRISSRGSRGRISAPLVQVQGAKKTGPAGVELEG